MHSFEMEMPSFFGPGSNDDIIDFTINSTGDITISYNWSGDDSEGGP